MLLGTAIAITVAFFILRPWLPAGWSTPRSPELYLLGVLGTLLALTPFAFALAKRSGASENPPAWFVAHVIAGMAGCALLIAHSGLNLTRAPALLIAGIVFLVAQGAWARTVLPTRIATTFGTRPRAFLSPESIDRERLAAVINEKQALLVTLDRQASEATFSPTLSHWFSSPIRSLRYARLAAEEARVIGHRDALPPAQRYWRTLHIAVACAFLLGVMVHVVTVTFFAGYVADGGEIHWWHITAWGGS